MLKMHFFFFQAEDGIRDYKVTGVQTCALPILFQLEDDRSVQLARIPAAGGGGAIERLIAGARVVTGFTAAPGGRVAVTVSTPDAPAEGFAPGGGGNALRPLSHPNAALLTEGEAAPTGT